MSAVHERSARYRERSGFLALALGLVAYAERFDRFLAKYGRRTEAAPIEHPVVYAVLGLVSFRRSVVAALTTAREEGSARQVVELEAEEPPTSADRARIEGLLR